MLARRAGALMVGWNRAASLLAYVAGAAVLAWGRRAETAGIFLLTQLPVVILIWFADSFGDWIGAPPFPGGLGDRMIDTETPPWLVAGFGWLILIGVFVLCYTSD